MGELFPVTPAETAIKDAHEIITRANREHSPAAWVPLLSGGHDSVCACHIASLHPEAPRPFTVYHIDTGTGAAYTRQYVEKRCEQFGWELEVLKSPNQAKDSYEAFVRERGFPGPARHSWVYARLKERVIQQLATTLNKGQRPVMFVTGSRRQESKRRMGYAVAVRRGDGISKTGHLNNPSRLWVAPCIDWVPENQRQHMQEFSIPRNKIKDLIGLSGECFCGANAGEDVEQKASEREMIRKYAPEVEAEISRLEAIAKELGKPCKWGHKPPNGTPDLYGGDECPLFMDLCIGCQK
jgi:3'-phosphoadenosine 5'-phosphosulfate sulfotransferase (PAPS reductase)/FAD synthetase